MSAPGLANRCSRPLAAVLSRYLMRALLFMLFLVSGNALAQQPGKPMSSKELSKFLGSVPTKAITWTKVRGPDFDVYYGHPNPPLTGDVGFYLGGWPSFTPGPESKIVSGKLGIFPVQWHRAVSSDSSIKQEAVIPLDDYWKVDIWVSAKHQADLDRLLEIISQLPTFSKKPKPFDSR